MFYEINQIICLQHREWKLSINQKEEKNNWFINPDVKKIYANPTKIIIFLSIFIIIISIPTTVYFSYETKPTFFTRSFGSLCTLLPCVLISLLWWKTPKFNDTFSVCFSFM